MQFLCKKNFAIFFLVPFLVVPIAAQGQYQSENLFYMVDNETSFQSFKNNLDQISIVSPQTFSISQDGVVWGEVDSRVLRLAEENEIQVIPLIMNPGFDRELLHNFLQDSTARHQTISMMVDLAKAYNFSGWQFDFENIHISDRKAFTNFYRETAEALHSEGFSLSAAVVPTNTDYDLPTAYHRFLYEYWRGAYDLKALAEIGDFLSLMTYSQHTRRTPPGPIAGIPWMKEMITHLLELDIAPSKISLGVPFYSTYWFADYSEERGGFINGRGATYETVSGLIERYDADLVWLDNQQCYYAIWNHDGVFEYAFVEDARSVVPKLNLVEDYQLRGISVWRLGQEDPAVWQELGKKLSTSN